MAVVPTEAKNIADVATRVREVLLLGSAALEETTAFATAAQGALADSALQPGDPVSDLAETASAKIMTSGERAKLQQIYFSRTTAAAADLTAYSAVTVNRWDDTSAMYPAVYIKVASEPAHILKFQDAALNWFEIAPEEKLSPYHAGCDGTGDETAAVQAVLDLAQTRGSVFDGTGPDWPVTKLTIAQSNNHFEFAGVTKFLAIDTAAQTCLVEGTRGNFTITGKLVGNCQYKTNYAAAFWFHNDTQIQFIDLNRPIAVGALIGIRIGDVAHGTSVTSEITVTEPRTYGCPISLQIEGGNTYITVVAPPASSADAFGGDPAWQALPRHALVNKGSAVNIIGGELIQTDSGLATDNLVEMQPGMFGTDISWGKVSLIGVVCETGGPLLKVTNPDALTGTLGNTGKAEFNAIGCKGFHSQDNAPFLSTVAGYPGELRLSRCNFWYTGGTRTQPNISCADDLCHVYVDENAFGDGFKGQLAGTVGGIVHFSKRSIYQAYNLPASNLVAGIQTLLWQTFVSSDDHLRFQGYYSAATGQFTVPAGGLRNVRVRAQAYAPGVTGYMVVREGTTEVARGNFLNDAGSVIFEKVDIAAGTLLSVDLYVTGGAGVPPSASGFLHTFTIEAMN